MDNRDIEMYSGLIRERQQELRHELELQAMFSDGPDVNAGLKRRVLLTVAASVVILTVAILTGAQFV